MIELSYPLAFAAGLLSFFSPCTLPLAPAYLAFLSGQASRTDVASEPAKRLPLLASGIAFVAGFTCVFVVLFYVLYAIEATLAPWRPLINIVAGLLVLLLALQVLGLLNFSWFLRELRVHPNLDHAGIAPAFILGITFAAGWTPCLGPTLGAILQVAANLHQFSGLPFMLVYSLGLAIPFLALAALADKAQFVIRKMSRAHLAINLVSGTLLMVFALLLITNRITVLNTFSFQAPFDL